MPIKERKLTPEEIREFRGHSNRAMMNLGLTNRHADPKLIVQAVDAFVFRWQQSKRKPQGKRPAHEPNPVDVALGLGAVWGDQLVRRFHWGWICLQEKGRDIYAVAAPNRSLVVLPTYYIEACLNDPQLDCMALLAFNLLVAGTIPPRPTYSYDDLMRSVVRIVPKR